MPFRHIVDKAVVSSNVRSNLGSVSELAAYDKLPGADDVTAVTTANVNSRSAYAQLSMLHAPRQTHLSLTNPASIARA